MPTPDSDASRTSDGRMCFLLDLSLSQGFVEDIQRRTSERQRTPAFRLNGTAQKP